MADSAKITPEELSAHARNILDALGNQSYASQAPTPAAPVAELYAGSHTGLGPEADKQAFLQSLQPTPAAPTPAHIASDAPTPQTFNGTPAPQQPQAPQQQATAVPTGGPITTPAEAQAQAYQNYKQSQRDMRDTGRDYKNYVAADEKEKAAEADAQQPILDNAAKVQQESIARQQQNTQLIQAQMTERMNKYNAVQTELETMAKEAPQDLFGKAGVNPILARIAIFFGGAGYAGYGPNKNLAMIENLADRNVQQQKMRYEMLQRVGQGHMTLYGQLKDKLESDTAVENALRTSTLQYADAASKAMANRYARPRAKADAMKLSAELNERIRAQNEHTEETYLNQSQQNIQAQQQLQMMWQQQQRQNLQDQIHLGEYNLKLHKQEREEANYENENSVEGFTGTFKPEEHKTVAKRVAGTRNIIATLNQMDDMLAAGLSPENIRQFAVENAINFAGGRETMDTGQNLQGREEKLANAFNVNRAEAFLYQLEHGTLGTDMTALRDSIEDTKATLARFTYIHARAYNKNIQFDKNDPLWGQYDPATYKTKWSQAKAEREGTRQGRAKLQNMKDWAADESGTRGLD